MAYFLKKSNLKRGVYLQIYESYYNNEKKNTSHKSYKTLGYVEDIKATGIEDPISYFKDYVSDLNDKRNEEKIKEKEKMIGDTPIRYLGHFLVKSLFDELKLNKDFNLLQFNKMFDFSVLDLLSDLVYSRILDPCSKSKTYNDVLPKLYGRKDISLSQIYDGINFLGLEYEKIIEIINSHLEDIYVRETDVTYFDGTNFYFEIDSANDFQAKGPSKEHRTDPIVGLGLLLDKNQIPISMKLFPGNESEKPILREIIGDLKQRSNIKGKTIQVADKGLNCSKNIIAAKTNGDGYLFSKSVKMLPQTEQTWVLLNNDYEDVYDDEHKVKFRYKSCVDDFWYTYTDSNEKKRKIKLKEKRVVTYNPSLAAKQRAEINKMVEKAKLLKASGAKKKEYGENSKYVDFKSTNEKGESTKNKVVVTLNQKKIEKDLKLAGYNLLVTSELNMKTKEIYNTYHNLWRIEQSFRIMKTQLAARPVYLQKKDSIIGHFLVCYVSVLLLRVLQFKVFNNKYESEQLVSFMRNFSAIEEKKNKFINITERNAMVDYIAEKLNLPLNVFYLNKTKINKIFNCKVVTKEVNNEKNKLS